MHLELTQITSIDSIEFLFLAKIIAPMSYIEPVPNLRAQVSTRKDRVHGMSKLKKEQILHRSTDHKCSHILCWHIRTDHCILIKSCWLKWIDEVSCVIHLFVGNILSKEC